MEATEGTKHEVSNPARIEFVNEVFEFWRVRMGHSRAKLDQKRRQKIRQRLLDGYEVKDLIDAIEGCALSDFHMGKNDRCTVYNDIELICRDASHVDRFIRLKAEHDTKKARSVAFTKFQNEEQQRRDAEQRERRHVRIVRNP